MITDSKNQFSIFFQRELNLDKNVIHWCHKKWTYETKDLNPESIIECRKAAHASASGLSDPTVIKLIKKLMQKLRLGAW